MKPYGLISDTHNFAWSAFSTKDEKGINSRLSLILAEFVRCAAEVHAAGGTDIYHAGDLFHVRGSVAPSVLNPTRDVMRMCHKEFGTQWILLPGNHDQEFKHSNIVGNAVQMIREDGVIGVVNEAAIDGDEHRRIFMLPWIENIAEFKKTVESWMLERSPTKADDLIIHAPVDGVIIGLPAHGISPEYLAGLGFGRVWAGHYHNAKAMPGGVFSIGALTHQTWSDVGASAGFWVVSDDGQQHFPSQAPRFVDIPNGVGVDELAQIVNGNYCRVKLNSPKTAEIKQARDALEGLGAVGVRVDVVREASRVRESGAIVKTGASVEEAINDFVTASKMSARVAQEANRVLSETA